MVLNFGKYVGKGIGEIPSDYMQWYLCDTIAQKPEIADAFRAELRVRWEPFELPAHMGLLELERYQMSLAAQLYTEAEKAFSNLGMGPQNAIKKALKIQDRYYKMIAPIKMHSTEDYAQAYKKVAEEIWEQVQDYIKEIPIKD